MREDPRYVAGSRFKYTPDYIDFNYDNLVNAIKSGGATCPSSSRLKKKYSI